MVVIKSDITNDIPVRELPNGELAVITKWGICPNMIGTVVQKNVKTLEIVGKDDGWTPPPTSEDYRVRVLPKGTILEVV